MNKDLNTFVKSEVFEMFEMDNLTRLSQHPQQHQGVERMDMFLGEGEEKDVYQGEGEESCGEGSPFLRITEGNMESQRKEDRRQSQPRSLKGL